MVSTRDDHILHTIFPFNVLVILPIHKYTINKYKQFIDQSYYFSYSQFEISKLHYSKELSATRSLLNEYGITK